AAEAAYEKLARRLEDWVKAGQQFPEAMKAAAPTDVLPPIKGEQFNVSPENPKATEPVTVLNPHAILSMPPLTGGVDGYIWRGFVLQVDLSVEMRLRAADGSETVAKYGAIPQM